MGRKGILGAERTGKREDGSGKGCLAQMPPRSCTAKAHLPLCHPSLLTHPSRCPLLLSPTTLKTPFFFFKSLFFFFCRVHCSWQDGQSGGPHNAGTLFSGCTLVIPGQEKCLRWGFLSALPSPSQQALTPTLFFSLPAALGRSSLSKMLCAVQRSHKPSEPAELHH